MHSKIILTSKFKFEFFLLHCILFIKNKKNFKKTMNYNSIIFFFEKNLISIYFRIHFIYNNFIYLGCKKNNIYRMRQILPLCTFLISFFVSFQICISKNFYIIIKMYYTCINSTDIFKSRANVNLEMVE